MQSLSRRAAVDFDTPQWTAACRTVSPLANDGGSGDVVASMPSAKLTKAIPSTWSSSRSVTKRLETGESFKNLSRSTPTASQSMQADAEEERRKLLAELKKVGGVSDGD